MRFFPDSGWYRLDYGAWTLFWYVFAAGSVPLYSHGHNEIGSFVLCRNGRVVITDPGRYSYRSDELGPYGKKAAAHNTVTLDGMDPYPPARRLYPDRYRQGRSTFSWNEQGETVTVCITHTGFERIARGCRATREFIIDREGIILRDVIDGRGSHRVRTYFHFDPEVSINDTADGSITVSVGGESLSIALSSGGGAARHSYPCGQRDPEPSGWFFPKYGEAVPAVTWRIDSRTELPYRAEYRIGSKPCAA